MREHQQSQGCCRRGAGGGDTRGSAPLAPVAALSILWLPTSCFPQQEKSSRGERQIISFLGVFSRWKLRGVLGARVRWLGGEGAGGGPQRREGPQQLSTSPDPTVPPPSPAMQGKPAAEVPVPAGGAPFRGCLQVPSTSPTAPLAPRGHQGCAHGVGQPSACIRPCRGWAYLPRAMWKPMGPCMPLGGKGRRGAGSLWGFGWVRGCVQSLHACVLPFVPRRLPWWMR